MTTDSAWQNTCSLEIRQTPQQIWRAFSDVTHWKVWNPGVADIRLDGDFASGSAFTMALPDGTLIRSELTDVTSNSHFADETWVDATRVRVEHRIEILQPGLCRVTYTIGTQGPDAQAYGEAISADFPEVLAGLERYLSSSAQ